MVKVKSSGPPVGLVAVACCVDPESSFLRGAPVYYFDQGLAESVAPDDSWGDWWQKKGQERFQAACHAYWRRVYGPVPGRTSIFRRV